MLTNSSGLLSVAASAIPIPGAGAVVDFLGGLFGGGGPTKDTHVVRFQQAQSSSDPRTAGTLVDQAFYHGWIQGVPDAALWQGIVGSMYQVATTTWQTYIKGLLAGAPMQYANVGARVATPQTIPAPGQAPTTAPATTGLLDPVLELLGFGPTRQTQLATTAGQAAGQQLGRTLILVVVVVVAVVILVRVLKR